MKCYVSVMILKTRTRNVISISVSVLLILYSRFRLRWPEHVACKGLWEMRTKI